MDFSAVQLINLVREMPQIYDSSMADFKIPEKKDQAWMKVAHKLNSSADECRKRWRTMRERYTRELKRYKSSDPSHVKQECPPDAASANVTWSLFDEMSFLYDHVKLRKARYSLDKSCKAMKVLAEETDPMIEDQHIDQHSSEATTAGQVYAKFKVQSVDGSDGQNRILINEEYKYHQMQTEERKHMPDVDPMKRHDSYVIINHCAEVVAGEENETVAEPCEEEEEEEEEDEEEIEEFLTDETHPHEHQQHHNQHQSSVNGPRIILTAPRDNSPSPQPMPQPLVQHQSSILGGPSGSYPKSLKRKHPSSATTTMTIEPSEHTEIVSMHHHHNGQAMLSTPVVTSQIHHVPPMQNGAILASNVHQPQDDNDFFCSAVACSLKQLNRVYNINAKVEIYKVLEKFIEKQDGKQ